MKSGVVSDAGPIISAARAGRLHLIEKVYRKIIVPPAVMSEVAVQGSGKPGSNIMMYHWIELQHSSKTKVIEQYHQRFGLGESEAISLAIEFQYPILVDEIKVIQEARRQNLKVFSTLQMLLTAKELGLISSVTFELNEYLKSGFRLSKSLYNHLLEMAKEK